MVLSYTLRNLWARRTSVIPTVFAIALSIGAITAMLALLDGLTSAFDNAGRPQVAIVAARGESMESSSSLPRSVVSKVEVAPGLIAPNALSIERVVILPMRRANGVFDGATVRAIDEAGFSLHAGLHVEGSPLRHGERGVLIGAQQLRKFVGFDMGDTIRIGRHRWPVVGVLHGPGTKFESELWVDREALSQELDDREPSVVYAELESPSAMDGFAAAIARSTLGLNVEAMSERAFYRRMLAPVRLYLDVIILVSLLLGLSAVVAATNTMYSAFLDRIRELATLMAIGFTRGKVVRLLLTESMLISVAGGLLGFSAGALIHGHAMTYQELSLIYVARVTPHVVGVVVLSVLAIGVFGALITSFQTLRLNVLSALRE